MFASRKINGRCFRTLSSLLLYNTNRNAKLAKNASPKLTYVNFTQPNMIYEDGFSSISHLNQSFNNGWCREMSTSRGRSMRSKVERRMQKESGKTLREIRRAKKLKKKLMTDEERLIYNLKRAKKKVALLLQKLKKYELPELPPPLHDPELFTPEQLQAYKKIGFRNKNYVPVGVRGVFGGVVQNMHLHWKFHETVQVCCDNFPKEKIKEMATMLARLSGGIVINVHNVKTIIMFRGRNYRQPKNLIPVNTLTKRKALFKARFEQALESQKLNIKKIEQQLRRMGVNPEDPVAMASIQRVASTFFNAIDKKEGSPYVFRDDKQSGVLPGEDLEHTESAADSDQEELDRFIAEIEDAADKEWAAEEAAEQEEYGKIRYRNKENFGGRVRRSEMDRHEFSDREERGGRHWKDVHDRRRSTDDDNDSDMSDSGTVGYESNLESDGDEPDEVLGVRSRSRGLQGNQDRIGRDYNSTGFRRNAEPKFRRDVSEEDSGSEHILSDLDNAIFESDTEEEGELRQPSSEATHSFRRNRGKPEYRSSNLDNPTWQSGSAEENDMVASSAEANQDFRSSRRETRSSMRNAQGNSRRKAAQEGYGSESSCSDSDIAAWESDIEEDLRTGNEAKYKYRHTEENEDYPQRQYLYETHEANRKKKTAKDTDENWDSD